MSEEKKQKKRFPNLEAEMAKKRVLKTDLAILLNRTNGTITSRMNGSSNWLVDEVIKIKEYLQTDMDLEELFEEVPDEDVAEVV